MPAEILEQTEELEGAQRHVMALSFLAKMIAQDELKIVKKPSGIRARRVWTSYGIAMAVLSNFKPLEQLKFQ